MTKLTEIIMSGGTYDPDTRSMKSDYGLRNVYVNPGFIISMREDTGMIDTAKTEDFIQGLNPDVGFTKLTLNATGHGVTQFTVIGSPEQIIEKFNQNR
tara:strand:+ start:842 stop:1135 length:294 start_codon:yes stop_codon:yes gene_type:complete